MANQLFRAPQQATAGYERELSSGYVPCACRDCFEIAITSGGPALCSDCEEAGCDPEGNDECGALNSLPDLVEEAEEALTSPTVIERQHHTCCGARIAMSELTGQVKHRCGVAP